MATSKDARRTAQQSHYVVVINNNAGSSARFDEEALKAASPDATFEILSVAPDDLDKAFDKAFSDKPSAVIVVGGDGTARTAAARAVSTGVPIIPMPGGTMNVLPKIVFGHGDMARAIADIPKLAPRSLDVGRVGGETFFLAAAFGFAGPDDAPARSDPVRTQVRTYSRSCRRALPQYRSLAPVPPPLAHAGPEMAQRPLPRHRHRRP